MKVSIRFFLTLIIFAGSTMSATAQDITTPSVPAEPATERPNAIEEQAYQLLEDVIAGTQSLKLPENRSRLQMITADLLWKRDPARARSLFSEAAANVVELERQTAKKLDETLGQRQSAAQLRQELILTAARREPALAYELFQKTRQRVLEEEAHLEQLLLTQIMTKDPVLASQKAEGLLERGEYSLAIVSLLELLQNKDKSAAARLTEKILVRLQADTLLNNYAALSLALGILRTGPRPSEPLPAAQSDSPRTMPAFSVPAYQQLLETVVGAALKATQPATGAQNQQHNVRDLLLNLRPLLPQIEQYLPARSQTVRQKINALEDHHKPRLGLDKLTYLTQQGTSSNLLIAASSAPSEMRDSLYQQAAFKALDEGSVEGARQIANDHLDSQKRKLVFQRIAAQQQLRRGESAQLEELRQALEMTSTHDRVGTLLQLAEVTKDSAKESRRFVDEAYGLATRPATNYKQLEDQRQVAHALAAIDPQRGLQVLESGVNLLNELLPAAASLSGFEVQIFSDGEMPLPGNSQLGAEVLRYGQELSNFAVIDFRSAVAVAEQFQYPEARLFARLSILQAVLRRE
jgi:hypothetical protein